MGLVAERGVWFDARNDVAFPKAGTGGIWTRRSGDLCFSGFGPPGAMSAPGSIAWPSRGLSSADDILSPCLPVKVLDDGDANTPWASVGE